MLQPARFKDFILIAKAPQAAEDRDMAEGHWLQSQHHSQLCNHPAQAQLQEGRTRTLAYHVRQDSLPWSNHRPLPAQG